MLFRHSTSLPRVRHPTIHSLLLDQAEQPELMKKFQEFHFFGALSGGRSVLVGAMAIAPEAHMNPIARAELAPRERGDMAPLRHAVRLALMKRDYAEAERRVSTCSECK